MSLNGKYLSDFSFFLLILEMLSKNPNKSSSNPSYANSYCNLSDFPATPNFFSS